MNKNETLQGKNLYGIALHQINTYWSFLNCADLGRDVSQTIQLILLQSKNQMTLREFNNLVNREMYQLARTNGWRKPWINNQEKTWYRLEVDLKALEVKHARR